MIEAIIKLINNLISCVKCQSQCCESHIERHGNDYVEDKNCFAIKINRKNSKTPSPSNTPPDTPKAPDTPTMIDRKSIIV